MNETVKIWTDISLSDLNSSRLLYENGHYRTSYFFFQQATEKANKAVAILGGEFNEKELRRISHNQLQIYKKLCINEEQDVKELLELFESFPQIGNHKIFENTNFIKFRKSLIDNVDFIDGLKNYDIVHISTKELDSLLKELIKIKDIRITIPHEFDSIFKTKMLAISDWIGKYGTEKALEDKQKLEEILNNNEHYYKLYDIIMNRIFPLVLDLNFITKTLYFCAIITIQHTSLTRYPENNINPNSLYNKRLPIVKKQNEFMVLLNEAIMRLKNINEKDAR